MFTNEEVLELGFMAQAIFDLVGAGHTWELPRPDFDSLVWKTEEIDPPSWTDVQSRMEILRHEYAHNQYRRDRLSEYPAYGEQLDMIYHEGIDAWRELIQSIKEKYPKPE